MSFLVNGYPENGYATGTVPSGPTSARYPFMDNLRISRFASVSKLVPTSPNEITTGDVVCLQNNQGEFLQFSGEKIVYVLGTQNEQDGSVSLKVIPYSEFLTFSQSDIPPYLQLAVDNDKLRTLIVHYEDADGQPENVKKVTGLEQTALDTDYLYPTSNQFELIDGQGNVNIVPYTILKHFVLDGSFKVTLMCSNQDFWTLKQNLDMGMLYYKIITQD